MNAASERPPWSPWLLRAFLYVISSFCGVLSAGCIILFFWVLSLSARSRYLIPITLLLLPVALVVILVGCPLYGIAAACGMKLHQLAAVYAGVRADGLRLQSAHETNPRLVEWAALEEVLKIRYPLCETHVLILKNGSEVRVDFVDEGPLQKRLEERNIRFQKVRGDERQADPFQ
jgi:hypothetical protein